MSKELTYNLPGYGFASCYLFDTAAQLMNLLERQGLVEKSKSTCQLGTMKYVYPGAHHTRYEYIFTQLMLINNVTIAKGITQRNVELSLSSPLTEYDNYGFKSSGADIMQCLAILSNAAHMYDTFTTSKLLTRLLQESKATGSPFFSVYKRNLPRGLHVPLDSLLGTSNYYKLHLFNMIHLLRGMVHTKTNEKLCCLGVQLLTGLIDPSQIKNEATKRVFFLYKKIRKISYLSVDMIYTPASFGVNLNRMLYTIHNYVDELFNEDSPINQAILQLEDIIHKQIYDSARCILNTTRIEQESYEKYSRIAQNITSIFDIRHLIEEFDEPYSDLHSRTQPIAIKHLIDKSELHLSWEKVRFDNILQFDDRVLSAIPSSRIAFGTQISQDLKKIYSVFGLISDNTICQDSQLILRKAINEELYNENQKIELVKFAIKSLFRYNEFSFNMLPSEKPIINDHVFIGNGCKNIAAQIRKRFIASNTADKNRLHEINSCVCVLEQLSYSGLVLCFVGQIKASKYNKTEKVDELDGLIYFPARDSKKPFAIIIEAKNFTRGEHEAQVQLTNTQPFLSTCLSSKIVKLNRCAYMELSINER